MTKLAVAVLALAIFSTPAFAGSCPRHMKAIDEALAKSPTLSAAQMTEVKQARAQGEEMHKAGKHAESLAALGKAETILKIK